MLQFPCLSAAWSSDTAHCELGLVPHQAFGRGADRGQASQSHGLQQQLSGRSDGGRGHRAAPVGEVFVSGLPHIQAQPPSKQQQQPRPRRGTGAPSGNGGGGSARSIASGGGGMETTEDSRQRNFALHSAPTSPMRALQQQQSQAFFGGGAAPDLHAHHMAPNGPLGGGNGGAHQAQTLGRHDRSRSFTSLGGLAAASHAQHQAAQQLYAHQQAHQQAAQQSHQSQQAMAAALAQQNPFKALSAVFAPHQLAALAAANGARHRLQVRCCA